MQIDQEMKSSQPT